MTVRSLQTPIRLSIQTHSKQVVYGYFVSNAMDDLDAIDAQVRALEAQLNQAKEVREAEAKKRREADELQRQIEELESQLSQQQGVSDTPECFQTNAAFTVQVNDKPPSRPTRCRSAAGTRQTLVEQEKPKASAIEVPSAAKSQPQKPTTASRPQPEIRSSSDGGSSCSTTMAPVVGASEQAKRNHQWSKPDWALPSAALPDDDIQKESIVNPLLKSPQKSNAYDRKVKPKELELIRGTFVSPAAKPTPDPRLVWIVVNVDGCKLGKIVMHLAGTNIDPIVDVFGDLKGLELQRNNKNKSLVVQDIDPVFTICSGNTGPGCFGIIQEGRDIFDQCMAAPPEAIITVKQSHIYPVKKAKPII